MLVQPDRATIITQAACVLHNLIIDKESDFQIDIQNEIETTCSQPYQEVNRPTNHRPTIEAINIRAQFMQYFNSEIGSVAWQNVYIV
jgi:hypothetical protein